MKSGEKADHGKFRAANYLFPGQDIPITGDNKNQNARGSSVVTSLAAGLAGLILYTQRLLLSDTSYNVMMPQRQKLEAWPRKALINQAFNVLAGHPTEKIPKDLYVALGSHFDKDPVTFAEESGFGGQPKVLETLMTSLMLMN
ncbi:hypothetical protein TCE0_047f18021 [Talaromyces pinophilus]|uniref:Peptidase S8/S53 domain-containing protein n=1 Tax=Talaromyces pinophilus TaxID=128442 RepID=A0A0B8N291_TALPI|nr:hypothetical protein TCE0_047f18021 [Talaromyces pinophilus]